MVVRRPTQINVLADDQPYVRQTWEVIPALTSANQCNSESDRRAVVGSFRTLDKLDNARRATVFCSPCYLQFMALDRYKIT